MDSCGLLSRDVDDNVQRGEAEDEDGSTSDTFILCTHDPSDLLIPIKANRPMTKSQCFHILLRAKRTLLYYDACVICHARIFSISNSSLVAVNPSLLQLENSSVITYTNFMHACILRLTP